MDELIKQNNELKLEIANLRSENISLKNSLASGSSYKEELDITTNRFKDFISQTNHFTQGLLGYRMSIEDSRVELLSLYAFNSSDKFVFLTDNKNVNLLSNEMSESYKQQIQEYLIERKSIPAFLAYVTMDLWNKKTFQ